MDKDLRKIVKELKRQGFEVRPTKRGHLAVYHDGELVTTFAGTPSDHRSTLNALAPLKRAGFQWPPKR